VDVDRVRQRPKASPATHQGSWVKQTAARQNCGLAGHRADGQVDQTFPVIVSALTNRQTTATRFSTDSQRCSARAESHPLAVHDPIRALVLLHPTEPDELRDRFVHPFAACTDHPSEFFLGHR
jgi:hypothetical protein